jgi:hypothetical protein
VRPLPEGPSFFFWVSKKIWRQLSSNWILFCWVREGVTRMGTGATAESCLYESEEETVGNQTNHHLLAWEVGLAW